MGVWLREVATPHSQTPGLIQLAVLPFHCGVNGIIHSRRYKADQGFLSPLIPVENPGMALPEMTLPEMCAQSL